MSPSTSSSAMSLWHVPMKRGNLRVHLLKSEGPWGCCHQQIMTEVWPRHFLSGSLTGRALSTALLLESSPRVQSETPLKYPCCKKLGQVERSGEGEARMRKAKDFCDTRCVREEAILEEEFFLFTWCGLYQKRKPRRDLLAPLTYKIISKIKPVDLKILSLGVVGSATR